MVFSKSDIIKKVNSFLLLPFNWDSYGSKPISVEAHKNAVLFIEHVLESIVLLPFVVPVSGGGIQFEWMIKRGELSVLFLPDGSVECFAVQGAEDKWNEVRFESFDVESLKNTLSALQLIEN